MSRIGKLPIQIPKGVKVQIADRLIQVDGPLGKLEYRNDTMVEVVQEGATLTVKRPDATAASSMYQGLVRALLNNMVLGVSKGYSRGLDITGVGYRAEVTGNVLKLTLGFSLPVELTVPKGIEATVERNTHIVLKSADKQAIGQFAAEIRAVRPPEPYMGKGIKYTEEIIRHKEGKKQG